ncbi:ATP-binding cassette domain-containing protein [Thalassotalea litorea]|uniref:ATP-binding cassette domain-containing protein n=1 Tax=Thalassotalea litorea TaxID=2020715 RepID=A0A5R9IM08_9GAMM|nr:AAA family ATPase [Thalassotalea litorea]TLU61049.1 ATP-binding cassette domain-containing protein [Thalassotalea litorea]
MCKIVIFGNSGSGKSTLARKLASKYELAHFDLDEIAWKNTNPPTRQPLEQSSVKIDGFMNDNTVWVIEGCYSDLIEYVMGYADKAIFLNLSIEDCIDNAKKRPWEPHKYPSKHAQDENLSMLLDWIKDYESRTDTFSLASHQALYDSFAGEKVIYRLNINE